MTINTPYIVFFCFLFSLSTGLAQTTKISGHVVDAESNTPLPFVNVSLKNTNQGTITDTEGNFDFTAKLQSDSLEIRYLGYKTEFRRVEPGKTNNFDIEMQKTGIKLGEVVVMPGKNPEDILLDLI